MKGRNDMKELVFAFMFLAFGIVLCIQFSAFYVKWDNHKLSKAIESTYPLQEYQDEHARIIADKMGNIRVYIDKKTGNVTIRGFPHKTLPGYLAGKHETKISGVRKDQGQDTKAERADQRS
jgi:hypothetical protein